MIYFYPTLRQRMVDQGITYKELSAVVGISKLALLLSMWGFRRFKMTEAVKICVFFNTTDIENLFLRYHFKPQ